MAEHNESYEYAAVEAKDILEERERGWENFSRFLTWSIVATAVVQVLEGEGAVARNREIMGATNPANAAPGTIRKEFAESIERNSVLGSDSPENAATEIGLNFKADEIIG